MNLILLISAVLFLLIIFQLFRSSELLAITDKEKKASSFNDKLNNLNAIGGIIFLLLLIVGLVWYSVAEYDNYVLPIASEHGYVTERLFWVTTAVTAFVFIVTQIVMFYFAYKYKFSESRKAQFYPENIKLELIWTIIPAIVLTVLIGWGLIVWGEITGPPPEDAEVIEVVGYQFAWASRYPGKDNKLGSYNYKLIDVDNIVGIDFTDSSSFDDFMPREIHVPKGKPVLFKIRSRDVIHSVYMPYMRSQMNAVPGMPTQFWFVPTKTTEEIREETGNPDFNYEILCNKICGRAHFSMKHTVVVLEEYEYLEWKKSQKPWIEKNPEYLSKIQEKNNFQKLSLRD